MALMNKIKNISSKVDLKNIPFYLLIAVIPFKLILTPICLFLVLLSYLFFEKKIFFKNSIDVKLLFILFFIFFITQLIGLILNFHQLEDFKKIDTGILLLIVPFLLMIINLRYKHIENAKTIFIISNVVFCLVSIGTLLYNLKINYEHRLNYNFIQTSMYHFHFPYDTLCLNIAYAFILSKSFPNYLKLIASILFLSVIVLTGVRLGLFIFIIITIFNFIMNIKNLLNFRTLLIIIFSFVLSGVLIKNSRYGNDKFFDTLRFFGFNTEKFVSKHGRNYHKISQRELLWSTALQAFKNAPSRLLGYGPKNSTRKINEYYIKNGNIELKNLNSHNQYLTTLLDNGLVGLILLLSIFILSIISCFKTRSYYNVLVIFLILIAFITESMLERQKGMMIFTVFLTLILIQNNNKVKILNHNIEAESL